VALALSHVFGENGIIVHLHKNSNGAVITKYHIFVIVPLNSSPSTSALFRSQN